MLKAVEALVNSNCDKKQGNHKVEFYPAFSKRCFIYHWTTICLVHDDSKEFWVDNG